MQPSYKSLAEGYAPTSKDYDNFQKLKQEWENPSWVFTGPPDTHEPSGNEISRPATDVSSHQLEQDKSTVTEFPKLSEEEINSLKTFVDTLQQNKEASQGFRKMLSDKESMEGIKNLMGDEQFREHALSELKNKESAEQAISLLENKESTEQLLSLLKDKEQVEKVSQSMSSQESEGVNSKRRLLQLCGGCGDYNGWDNPSPDWAYAPSPESPTGTDSWSWLYVMGSLIGGPLLLAGLYYCYSKCKDSINNRLEAVQMQRAVDRQPTQNNYGGEQPIRSNCNPWSSTTEDSSSAQVDRTDSSNSLLKPEQQRILDAKYKVDRTDNSNSLLEPMQSERMGFRGDRQWQSGVPIQPLRSNEGRTNQQSPDHASESSDTDSDERPILYPNLKREIGPR